MENQPNAVKKKRSLAGFLFSGRKKDQAPPIPSLPPQPIDDRKGLPKTPSQNNTQNDPNEVTVVGTSTQPAQEITHAEPNLQLSSPQPEKKENTPADPQTQLSSPQPEEVEITPNLHLSFAEMDAILKALEHRRATLEEIRRAKALESRLKSVLDGLHVETDKEGMFVAHEPGHRKYLLPGMLINCDKLTRAVGSSAQQPEIPNVDVDRALPGTHVPIPTLLDGTLMDHDVNDAERVPQNLPASTSKPPSITGSCVELEFLPPLPGYICSKHLHESFEVLVETDPGAKSKTLGYEQFISVERLKHNNTFLHAVESKDIRLRRREMYMFVDRIHSEIPEPAVFYDKSLLPAHEVDIWTVICDSLAATPNYHVLYTLRFVNRKLSRISTDSLLENGLMWKLHQLRLSTPRLAFEELELHAFDRRIPKMPLASRPPGDEFRKVLTLVPLNTTLRTAFGVEVIDLLPVVEGEKFQYVEGRLGFAASSQKTELFEFLTLVERNISLWAFDPLLHLHKESQPPDDSRATQSFHDRLSMSLDDYCQYLEAMERFCRIRLPSSKRQVCQTPYSAFLTFPERPPNGDKIAPCIVSYAWPCEHVVKLVSETRGKRRDTLLSKAGTTVKEFMKAGWVILFCEKYLYRHKHNGDFFISAEGLTKAEYLGNNVTPEQIQDEVDESVERLGDWWQEYYGYESDDSSESRGIIFPQFSTNIPVRKVADTV